MFTIYVICAIILVILWLLFIIYILSFICIDSTELQPKIILPPRNEEFYKYVISKKQDIIDIINRDNNSIDEINNIINLIVDLYITTKSDFIEDYNSEDILIKFYKLQKTNPNEYKQLKRHQILNNISNTLKIKHKNELNEQMIIDINLIKDTSSFEDLKQYTNIKLKTLKSTLKQYDVYLMTLLTSIEYENQINNDVNIIINTI